MAQARLRIQAGLNISHALTKGDLHETHPKEVIPRRKRPDTPRIIVPGHHASKLPMRHTRHHPRENGFTLIYTGEIRKNHHAAQIVSKAKSAERASHPQIIKIGPLKTLLINGLCIFKHRLFYGCLQEITYSNARS
jgi:hypothetical protein